VSLNQSLNFGFEEENDFSDAEIHEDLYERQSTVWRRPTEGKLMVGGRWFMSSCSFLVSDGRQVDGGRKLKRLRFLSFYSVFFL
jgi:hypothetical protein